MNPHGSVRFFETIKGVGVGRGRIVRQTRSGSEFAQVELSIAPLKRGEGFLFICEDLVRGSIPQEFLSSVEAGVSKSRNKGRSGFPLTDLSVTVVDGAYHDVDSTPAAFEEAAARALAEAIRQVPTAILEPLLSVSIRVPRSYVASVNEDLRQRRARMDSAGEQEEAEIKALVPETEFEGFAVRLAALTDGQGELSLQPAGYQELPSPLTGAFFCRRCRREFVLPVIRGVPHFKRCPICDGDFEPPDFFPAVHAT